MFAHPTSLAYKWETIYPKLKSLDQTFYQDKHLRALAKFYEENQDKNPKNWMPFVYWTMLLPSQIHHCAPALKTNEVDMFTEILEKDAGSRFVATCFIYKKETLLDSVEKGKLFQGVANFYGFHAKQARNMIIEAVHFFKMEKFYTAVEKSEFPKAIAKFLCNEITYSEYRKEISDWLQIFLSNAIVNPKDVATIYCAPKDCNPVEFYNPKEKPEDVVQSVYFAAKSEPIDIEQKKPNLRRRRKPTNFSPNVVETEEPN